MRRWATIPLPSPISAVASSCRLRGEIPFGVETDLYQAYIDMEDGSSVRIRKRGLRGNYVYFMTRKSPIESQSIITERQIGPRRIYLLPQLHPLA